MNLLPKDEYQKIESELRNYTLKIDTNAEKLNEAISELLMFFSEDRLYAEFIKTFYLNRNQYQKRYPTNRMLFNYLQYKLNVEEPTLYVMRKEIVYKAAMIFYKYKLL